MPAQQPSDGGVYYKPDWPRAQARWRAFWDRAETDRPCMDIRAPSGRQTPPVPPAPSLEAFYLDPDCVAARWLDHFERTTYVGEGLPTGGFLMGGYALGCGPAVRFAETTVWHPVMMESIRDPLRWNPGPDDPWTQKLEAVVRRLLDLAPGRFFVGYPMQVTANDLLSLLRGVGDFLMDLAEDIALCVARLDEVFAGWDALFRHFRAIIDERQGGACIWNWPGLWHPRSVVTSQSDMSCMISPAMFERYVLHEMDKLGELYGEVWYHVDGPGAIKHVPALLGRPYVRALQYVAGAGQAPNGPAWMDLYRRIQAAGRCLDIDVPPEHVEHVVRRLRPEGLVVRTWAPSRERAEELLGLAVRWCGTHAGSGD